MPVDQDLRIALCALLHDIGKPILRYILRVSRNIESASDELDRLLRDWGIDIRKKVKHEKISEEVLKNLGIICREVEALEKAVAQSDVAAAIERGFEEEYQELSKKWDNIEKKINKNIRRRGRRYQRALIGYSHYTSPLLTPLWMLGYISTRYADSIGPCGTKAFTADDSLKDLVLWWRELLEVLKERDQEKIAQKISSYITDLVGRRFWLPVKLLDPAGLQELSLGDYWDASQKTSYGEVVQYMLKSLSALKTTWCGRLSKGFVDTLGEVLRYSLLLVPSAVFAAMAPDIGLYSHSKLVAAYTLSHYKGGGSLSILVVDGRNIKGFIAAPVKAAAASRVIRGRSLLAELVFSSLANYALKLFGDLPSTNILSWEGGTISILVPYDDDFSKKVDKLKEISKKLYKRFHSLRFTIAYSKNFTLEDIGYKRAIYEERGGHPEILRDLEERLANEKSMDQALYIGKYIDSCDIEGFDAITMDPVSSGEIKNNLGVRITEENKEYADLISGAKLELGDVISDATHLSLVAGSVGRNLAALISINVYYKSKSGSGEELYKPDEGSIGEIVNDIMRSLCRIDGPCISKKLIYRHRLIDKDLYVALIPLPELGSLYILISKIEQVSLERPEIVKDLGDQLSVLMREIKLEELLDKVRGLPDGRDVEVRIAVVNAAANFIYLLESEEFKNLIRRLEDRGISVSLSSVFYGVYHPVNDMYTLKFKDLDEFELIALAKINCDSLGEVKKFLSIFPSRMITLSDLIQIIISGKSHIEALREVLRNKREGLIMLYAGGDDISFYGDWRDVLAFTSRFYSNIVAVLSPLSFTGSIAIDRPKMPLLELYNRVLEALLINKKEAKGSVTIDPLSSQLIITCEGGGSKLVKVVKALAPHPQSMGWPKDLEPLHSLEGIVRMLEMLENGYRFSDYKRDLDILSRIASIDRESVMKLYRGEKISPEERLRILRAELSLSYICARRKNEIEKINELGKDIGMKLCISAGGNILDSLIRLLNYKTALDILLLAMRRGQS